MKGLSNAVKDDLQTVYNIADVMVDLCNEESRDKLLEQIKGMANRIKKVTKVYNN